MRMLRTNQSKITTPQPSTQRIRQTNCLYAGSLNFCGKCNTERKQLWQLQPKQYMKITVGFALPKKLLRTKLSVIVTKSGEKTDTGKKLQNYCGLFITPDGSRRICLCCKKKMDSIVSKSVSYTHLTLPTKLEV